MGKGFDEFMKNPYWKSVYDEAPSDRLRAHYRLNWDHNPFVLSKEEYEASEEQYHEEMSKIKLTASDVDYMVAHASNMERSYLRKWADRLRAEEKEDT